MKYRQVRVLLRASVLLAGALGALGASAVEVVQTLGQVKTFGSGVIADLDFNTENGETSLVNANAGPVVACKLTAGGAFYCLQGQTIIEWANGPQAAASRDLFSCDQPELSITSCTGLTVDDTGVLWLAGKNKQKSHSLVRVEKVGEDAAADGCSAGQFASTYPNDSGNYDCFEAKTRYTGRPLLVDVDVVTDADGNFEGIVGLEQRRTAMFFSAGNPNSAVNSPEAVTIGTGRDWYLRSREDLLGLTIVDPDVSGIAGRYALVATSHGRVLAKRFLTTGTSTDVSYEVYPKDPTGTIKGTGCADPTGTPGYSVRTSTQSDVVFLADRACGEVMALKPTEVGATGAFELKRAKGEKWLGTDSDGTANFASFDIPVLSTEVTYEVCNTATPVVCEQVTVAATDGLATGIGLGFNLGECDAAALPDGDAPATACEPVQGFSLWDVKNVDAGVTLYKIEQIPDCRYVPDVCRTLLGLGSEATLSSDNLADGLPIYDPQNVGHPAAQFLVVNSLLPERVTSQFVDGLPYLLMSPYFRAQKDSDYLFEAFAFKAEPGLSISGTFEAEFQVAQLAGRENGCVAASDQLDDLLEWDTVTRASEVHPNVLRLGAYPEDPGVLTENVDVLLNTGCGSSRVSSFGKSFFFYNTEPTPDTFIPSRGDDPETDDVDERVVVDNDAVFARMVGRLHDDLGQVLSDYACLDGNDSPLALADCTALIGAWEDADRQLQRCLDATYQPKASASNQNCQSFVTQFGFFKRALSSVLPNGDNDVANRLGELLVRVRVFEEVYYTRFVPSIPVGGFCAETGTCPVPAP